MKRTALLLPLLALLAPALAAPAAAATSWHLAGTALTEQGVADGAQPWVLSCSLSGTDLTVTGVSQEGSGSLLDLRLPVTNGGSTEYAIVKIGASAFKGRTSLKEVRLPDSATVLEYSAFQNCAYLASVRLPDGLRTMGNDVFSGCVRLRSVEPMLPEGVTALGSGVFDGCKRLASPLRVGFGAPSVSLGYAAFRNCAALPSAQIGPGVAAIPQYGFYQNTALASVALHDGITSIGTEAFNGCTALSAVVPITPASLASLGSSAYRNCPSLAGEPVLAAAAPCTIGGYAFQNSAITSLEIGAFASGSTGEALCDGCPRLRSVSLGGGITSIGNYAFRNCTALRVIGLPPALVSIGSESFKGCTALDSVTPLVPASVTTIGSSAFQNCEALRGDLVFAADGAPATLGGYAFDKTGISSALLGDGIPAIGDYAFRGCVRLSSVRVPAALATYGTGAFADCANLEHAEPLAPASLTKVGGDAFKNCARLSGEVALGTNGAPCTLGSAGFQGTRITSLALGDAISGTVPYAFCQGCEALTNVVLGAGITTIGSYAFYNCTALLSVALPDGLTLLEGDCFKGCTALETVTPFLPPSLERIKTGAFNGCTKLAGGLVLGDGAGTLVVDASGNFASAAGIASVTIRADVSSIPQSCFQNCTGVREVVFEAKPSWNNDAFSGFGAYQSRFVVPAGDDGWNSFVASSSTATKWEDLAASVQAEYAARFPGEPTPRALTKANPAGQWIVSYDATPAGRFDLVVAGQPGPFASGAVSPAYGSYTDIALAPGLPFALSAPLLAPESDTLYRCAGYRVEEATAAGWTGAEDHALADPDAPAATYDPDAPGLRRFSWLWEPAGYKVSVTPPPDPSLGSVTVSGADADGYFAPGATATVTAVGGSGSPFARWRGDVPAGHETDATLQLVVDGPKSLVPEFASGWVFDENAKTLSDSYWTLAATGTRGAIVVGSPKDVYEVGLLDLRKPVVGGGVIVGIGENAFSGDSVRMLLREVRLPDTLESIGSKAFYRCGNLATVTPLLPSSVTNLMGQAFDNDGSSMALAGALTLGTSGASVTISGTHHFRNCRIPTAVLGPGVTAIPNSMFENNQSLLDVRAHDGIRSIGDRAFMYCPALTNFWPLLPASLTSLGNNAFDNNGYATALATPLFLGTNGSPVAISGGNHFRRSRIPTAVLGPGVTAIPGYFFENDTALLDVRAHDGISSIGDNAFYGCSALTNFWPLLPASLTSLGTKVFDNNGSAMSLATPLFLGTNGTPVAISGQSHFRRSRIPTAVLGPGVTAIPGYFFENATALLDFRAHDDIASIGDNAFYGCTALTNFWPLLPASLTSLGKQAFRGASSLSGELVLGKNHIDVSLHADGYQFYGTSITNAYVGPRAGAIPPYAFANNKALADVRLVSMASIGNCAFESDTGLRALYLGGPVPELHANAFRGWTAGQCLLHVQTRDETWEAWLALNVDPWAGLTDDLRDDFLDDRPGLRLALGRTKTSANPASQWVVYWARFPPPTVLIVK